MAIIGDLFVKLGISTAAFTSGLDRAKLKVNETAKEIRTKLRKETSEARDAGALLGRTFGVQLPTQVQKFLASVGPVRSVLARAFTASVFVGFGAAIIAVIPKIKEMATELGGMGEAMKKLADENIRANEALLLSTKAGAAILLQQVNQQIEALERPPGTLLGAALGAAFPGTGIGRAVATDREKEAELISKRIRIVERMNELDKLAAENRKNVADATDQQRVSVEKVNVTLAQYNELVKKARENTIEMRRAVTTLDDVCFS